MENKTNLAILMFDDMEVLDFAAPYEIFSVVGGDDDSLNPFNVYTVAEEITPVIARNNLSITPHFTLSNCPRPDILVVPGGNGTRREMNNSKLLDWIKSTSDAADLVLSVCTGSLLLGKAGLLDGLSVTTHHGALDLLGETATTAHVQDGKRFIDNGKIIVSAGVTAGIDMCLYVVAKLHGIDKAKEVAEYIEYENYEYFEN